MCVCGSRHVLVSHGVNEEGVLCGYMCVFMCV